MPSIKQQILDVMEEEEIDPSTIVKTFTRHVSGCGIFYCHQCKKVWSSHHALCRMELKGLRIIKRWRQKCITCQKYVVPSWKPDVFKKMIRNVCKRYKMYLETGGKRTAKKIIQAPAQPTKPHKSDLCEACKDGICAALRSTTNLAAATTTDQDILAQGLKAITLQ